MLSLVDADTTLLHAQHYTHIMVCSTKTHTHTTTQDTITILHWTTLCTLYIYTHITTYTHYTHHNTYTTHMVRATHTHTSHVQYQNSFDMLYTKSVNNTNLGGENNGFKCTRLKKKRRHLIDKQAPSHWGPHTITDETRAFIQSDNMKYLHQYSQLLLNTIIHYFSHLRAQSHGSSIRQDNIETPGLSLHAVTMTQLPAILDY